MKKNYRIHLTSCFEGLLPRPFQFFCLCYFYSPCLQVVFSFLASDHEFSLPAWVVAKILIDFLLPYHLVEFDYQYELIISQVIVEEMSISHVFRISRQLLF